jgi:thiamine-phosphate pyrophosphorylase
MGESGNSQPMTSVGAFEQAVYRILDANLDRAREGLRIVEEWCRFGLNNAHLTNECKHLRQELASWHHGVIRAARDTPGDPGTELTHAQEAHRTSVTDVLQANFCRVQEALRVLEEYGKLYQPEMGSACKQMRYRVYTLESLLLGHDRLQRLKRSPLYLVTAPHDNLFGVIEAALQGGLTLVQYRDKESDDITRVRIGKELKELCHRYNALFIMNDRVDLALATDADGVHLGQQDVPVAIARQVLGSNRIVGRSTTNPDEMHRAIQEGVDYIGVGPVFETPTKPGKAAAGFDYVRYAADHAPIPWFAIGGIDPNNLQSVLNAQAQRVAVVRALMYSDNPTLMAQYFLSQLQRVQAVQ